MSEVAAGWLQAVVLVLAVVLTYPPLATTWRACSPASSTAASPNHDSPTSATMTTMDDESLVDATDLETPNETYDDADPVELPVRQPLDLLVWDAPNIDMTLSNIIGARPSPASRPRFDAVARWLVAGAGDREVEGSVFTNVPPGAATGMRGWVEALRSFGYSVFAKPKLHHDDDVDLAMLQHISDRAGSHHLTRLIVASGDGRNFTGPLEDLARDGVEVVVVSFSEVAGYALESDLITFVDLEDVPGAFMSPLDRIRLDALPVQGAWLRPTRTLREVVANMPAQ